MTKPKTCPAPEGPWHKKFLKTVPMVDENGDPIPQNPPLTKSFWVKPKTTASILNGHIQKQKKSDK